MDKQDALGALRQRLARMRVQSYTDLVANWLDQPESVQILGRSGVEYQVEIEGFWDDPRQEGGNLRIFGSIDDGGWRAFSPLTDSFIVAPDGSFIGE